MDATLTLPTALEPAARAARTATRRGDDTAMLRAAAELTRDLLQPSARVYWFDLLASCLVGYGALAGAVVATSTAATLALAAVAAFALYRAMSFIHEISHMKRGAVRGFWLGWNALVGVPLLIPSFMYEGVHNLHHARTRYGTVEDPEYLPLASMRPWTLPLFVVAALLAPVALLVRYAVLAPLSLLMPRLRAAVVGRYSGLVINPEFRRRPAEGDARRRWLALETACAVWATVLVALMVTGAMPLRTAAIVLGVAAAVALVNQVRTLVAHLWDNEEGEAMSVTAQYLDTVNVPPPALLPVLWAPVGLRYHALHHLLPGVPYHALGAAHRRLTAALAPESPFHVANHPGLPRLVARLATSSWTKR